MTAACSIRFGHVGLNCVDVEATERFYSDFFGFRRDNEILLGDKRLVFISSGDVVFELFEAKGFPADSGDATGPTEPGFRHLALQVDDVAAVLAALGGEAEITQGPLDLSGYGLSDAIAWLRDPDGRILEIYQ
ncbi:MAG: VOC family protein [Geobacteraceae bacterium]|nr:VOC family protein [Geobacteraceae bacterium]